MSQRRDDEETRTYRGDGSRPARPRRQRDEEQPGSPILTVSLTLAAVVLLAGATAAGLWWYSRRAAPRPGTETPAAPTDLEAAIAEADRLDPGWRYDELWAKRAVLPPAENSALIVLEAGKLLPRGGQGLPEGLSALLDRAGQFRLDERPGEPRLDERLFNEMNAWLKPRAAALKVALTLADGPRSGRFEVQRTPDYISIPLPHLDTTNQLVTLLQVEALRRTEVAGDPQRQDVFRAMLNLGRAIGDEPFLFSQFVRLRYTRLALRELERGLARTTPSDAVLATAQKLLNEEAGHNALLAGWRGERATLFGLFEAVDTGKLPLKEVQKNLRDWNMKQGWPDDAGPGSAALRAARVWHLRHLTALVEVARKPAQDQPAALARLREHEMQAPPLATLFYDNLDPNNPISNSQKAFQQREALLRSALVALAAERFRLQKGRWPLEPKEMDASLVGSLPADPYDGSPLRFRRLDDGLVVYSIGPDGRDDGGDLGDRAARAPDIGFRLWDVARRR